MDERNVTNTNGMKSMFTVKKVLRVLSVFCLIFLFCPSFLVSCSGKSVNVSVMTAVDGVSAYGGKVVDPYPIMLICLFIPVAVLILLFIKKFSEKKTAGIILGCTAADLVIMFIFRSTVKKLAEENYCSFKTTGWYVFNIIVLILMVVLTALVILSKMELETNLISFFSGDGAQGAIHQMSATMNQIAGAVTQLADNVATNINNNKQKENTIGFCPKCSSPILHGNKFCTTCGMPVPESMLAEAVLAGKEAEEAERRDAEREEAEEKAGLEEEANKIEDERKTAEAAEAQNDQRNDGKQRQLFCQNCGSKPDSDAVFCETCGSKLE